MKQAWLALILVLPGSGRAEAGTATPAASAPAEAANAQPLVMDAMTVYGDTKLAFGFGLQVVRIENPRAVLQMVVGRVQAGSDAERKGLKPGSRVIAIDGRDVASYEATFVYGSELNRIFVDRPEGAHVTLQVIAPGKKKPQKLTIVRRTLLYEPARIGGLPN